MDPTFTAHRVIKHLQSVGILDSLFSSMIGELQSTDVYSRLKEDFLSFVIASSELQLVAPTDGSQENASADGTSSSAGSSGTAAGSRVFCPTKSTTKRQLVETIRQEITRSPVLEKKILDIICQHLAPTSEVMQLLTKSIDGAVETLALQEEKHAMRGEETLVDASREVGSVSVDGVGATVGATSPAAVVTEGSPNRRGRRPHARLLGDADALPPEMPASVDLALADSRGPTTRTRKRQLQCQQEDGARSVPSDASQKAETDPSLEDAASGKRLRRSRRLPDA